MESKFCKTAQWYPTTADSLARSWSPPNFRVSKFRAKVIWTTKIQRNFCPSHISKWTEYLGSSVLWCAMSVIWINDYVGLFLLQISSTITCFEFSVVSGRHSTGVFLLLFFCSFTHRFALKISSDQVQRDLTPWYSAYGIMYGRQCLRIASEICLCTDPGENLPWGPKKLRALSSNSTRSQTVHENGRLVLNVSVGT